MSLTSTISSATSPIAAMLSNGGPQGILGLTTVAAGVLLPLTQVQTMYGVTLGYGGSVAAMGLALRAVYHPNVSSINNGMANAQSLAAIAYGIRLTVFLWCRQALQWRPSVQSVHQQHSMARWKRIPFSCALALFYAFMATPLLYVMQNAKSRTRSSPAATAAASSTWWETLGLVASWSGIVLQAIADGHKSWVKSAARRENTAAKNKGDENIFVGPTGGVYRICRHPNYFGEILHWTGQWLVAVPSLDGSALGWTASALGWMGIVGIMSGATARLVDKQETKYGGQPLYENWKQQAPYPWIPLYQGPTPKKKESKK